MFVLIRHKVADFAKWKPVYDGHLPARQKAGLKEVHLLRNNDNPTEVILLFSAEDLDKAKAFVACDDVHQTMQRAGANHRRDARRYGDPRGGNRSGRQAGHLSSQIAAFKPFKLTS